MCRAPAKDHSLDWLLAATAGLAFAAVNLMEILERAGRTVGVNVVAQLAQAVPQRPAKDQFNRPA